MTWLNDLNNQNQKQLGNYVQNLNEGNSGGNWLQKTQESNIQKISQPSEVMKWLGDTSKNVMENIQDQESLVWKGPEGVNEALKTLAWQAVTFMPSIALGTGRIAYEKGRNLTVPEDKQISPKGIYRKAMRDASYLPGLIEPPQTSTGKAIVKPVEKFFHWAFTVPRNIGKDMGEFYGPNIGWLSEQALTLGMLKITHATGSELHSGIRKITRQARVRKANSPRMKSKAEELDQLLKNINKSKQSSRYDAEFEKKVNEFESIIQAEMQFEADLFMENQAELAKRGPAIMPQEIQRPKGVPKPPPKQIPEPIQKIMNFARVAKERMEKDRIDNPILSDVIETSKRGKFDTIDLKSLRLKNERRMGKLKEKQYVKDKVEDNIESRRPDLRNTEDAEAYGFQATPEQIKDLEYFRDQSLKIQKDLKKAGDINGAFYEAQMGQFYREALEMQKGVPEKSLMDTLKEKKPITEAEGKLEKQNLKKQVVEGVLSGNLKGAVRFTTTGELRKAITNQKLTKSKEYDAIHAQPIIEGLPKEDVSFVAYGDYTKHNVAMVFPEKYVKTKLDAHTSEVLIDPDIPLKDIKFFVGNQKKSFTYPELIRELKKPTEVPVSPTPIKTEVTWRAQSKRFTDIVKDDLEIATDLGIFADIKEGLESGKSRTDIVKDLRANEYLIDDMKEFKYSASDLSHAIRAVEIVETNNPKTIQSLKDVIQKESEIKIKEKPEPKYQIDPETGRLPGVEAPIKESDLGTTDVITAYRARQRPVVFESGKVAKSRFMAEKTAQEQGLIGELTKDPNSEGWLVRPSREASKQYIKEMTAEWEKFLEEDMKASEKLDVAEDPSTWDTLKQILSSERGELKIESSDFKSIQDFIKRHKISPRDAMEMLSNQGISDKQIGKILSIPSIQKSNIGEPDKDSKWLKPGQKGSEMLPARKLAKGKEAPQVSRKDARTIEQAPNINAPMFGEKLRWKTSEGLLTSLGDPVREIFFRHAIKGERQASDITVKLIKESNQLKKSLPIKSRWKSSERIDNYAMSRQKDGKTRLEAMGVKIIERLNPKEQKVYDKLQEIYKDLYNQINTQRRAIGQNEFPAVKNYSTWIHDLAKLDSVEKISMLSKMATIQKGLDRMGKFPSKIDKMGRVPGMKGHEKFRGGPDTPGALKLDAFDNFNRYAVMAGDVIGKSKDLAYLHELLHPQFELYKNAPNTYNFLSEWLDYQKGREHHLFITNPKTRRILGRLQGNIAVSYLTYAPKSVFVQLSSINNSIAEIGATRLGQGFSRSLNPASVKRALKESNILSTRTPEFIIMDAMSQIPTLPGKVGKVLHKTGKRAKQIGMKPLSIADNIVAIATWLGAEVQAKGRYKKAKTDKDIQTFARDFADDVVVRAQGSAARSARSPIQRSAEGKFVTTLQTFTIANWDYITRHLMGIKNPDITKPQQLAKAMKWIATSTIISQGFEELEWRSPIPQPVRAFQESLEQTSDKVKAIIAAGKELLEFIPIYGGKYKFGSEITGAVMEQLVRLGGGDITALPRLMGMPGYSTLLKGYRAEKREGTAVDILMGRYVKKLRKRLSKMGMGGL